MTRRPSRIALAALLVVTLAGCDHKSHDDDALSGWPRRHSRLPLPAVTPTPTPTPTPGKQLSLLQMVSNDGTMKQAPGAADATPAAAGANAGGSDAGAGSAAIATALASAAPMAITAAQGGAYRSPDGDLTVEIPPGALQQDATVRFARVDTTGLPEGPAGAPGIVVAGDFGGAKVDPNAIVNFRARVDDRFMQALSAAGGDAAALGLTRDAQGRWELPVAVRADAVGRQESVTVTPVGRGALTEVARLPVDAAMVPQGAAERRDPDPLPRLPVGMATMQPLPVDDPLVARYPGRPVSLALAEAYHPVQEVSYKKLPQPVPVRRTVAETVCGLPAMLSCYLDNQCSDPVRPLVEAVRFNTAVTTNRLPPQPLVDRVHAPTQDCH